MRSHVRVVQLDLEEYSEGELRAAHAALVAENRLMLSYLQAMEIAAFRYAIRGRAGAQRRRVEAQRPSGYVRADSTDIRRTIARAMADLEPLAQRSLDLERRT